MGNSFSYVSNDENSQESHKEIDKKNLIDHIDMIATNYVLKQNMIDMLRFTDKQYYDNLVILTSTIMNKQLNSVDIGILKDRVLNGNSPVNNNNSQDTPNNNTNNNTIHFSDPNTLKEITMKNDKQKKKALLLISKFYVKIMTIFSAITSVIDPQYVYETETGEKKYFFLKDFNDYKMLDKVENKIKISQLMNPFGLVKKRLSILKNKFDNTNDTNGNSEFATINPGEKFCTMNEDDNYLKKEVGIKELDSLYFDVYDYDENKWNKRSPKMERQYQKDLLKFYRISTGKKNMPSSVKSFSDIEMLKYNNLKRCKNKDYYKDLLVSKNDTLFLKYMQKIDEIQEISRVYKQKLLTILKSIFVSEESNSETKFTIDPALTIDTLMNFQDQTKKCILSIYTNCERLFIEALILYERMYENQYGKLVESVNEFALNSNTIGQLKDAQTESGFGNSMTISPFASEASTSMFNQSSNTSPQVESVKFDVPPSSNSQQQPTDSNPFGSQISPAVSSIQEPVPSFTSFGSQPNNQVPEQKPMPSFSQSPISFGSPSSSSVSTPNHSPFETVQYIEPKVSEISSLETNSSQQQPPSPFISPAHSSPFNPVQMPINQQTNSFMPSTTVASDPTQSTQLTQSLSQNSSLSVPIPAVTNKQTNSLPNSPPFIPTNSVIEEGKLNSIVSSNNNKINNTQINSKNNAPNKLKKGLFSISSIFGTPTNEKPENMKQEQLNEEHVNNGNIQQSSINQSVNSATPLQQNDIIEQSSESVNEPHEVSIESGNVQTPNVSSVSNNMISNNQITQPNTQETQHSEFTNNNIHNNQNQQIINNASNSESPNQQESINNANSMTNNDPQVIPESMNQVQQPNQISNGNNSQQQEEQVVENNSAVIDEENQPNKVGGHQEMFQQIKDSITSVFL